MQGPIAQALALTVAGNAVIAGREFHLWPECTIFRWTKTFDFVSEADAPLFPTPTEWLGDVRANSTGVRLHSVAGRKGLANERESAGFVGGGRRWIVEVMKAGGDELWQGFDHLGDRKDKERKIWNTTYVRQTATLDHGALDERSIAEVCAALRKCLTEIGAFAREIGASNFADCFENAVRALDLKDTGERYLKDVEAIANFDDAALSLIVAAQHAWVFGGMGSWNDMSFEGEQGRCYETLSDTLFSALNDAIVAAANSTCKDKQP